MKKKSIEDLLNDLESSDEADRVYAVEDLCGFDNVEIVPTIINILLNEKSQLVCEAMVDSLQKMISPEVFDEIFKMFDCGDAFIRNATTMIFASGGDSAINYLAKSFPGSNNEIRKLILDSLFEIGTPFAAKTIRLGLIDQNINVLITSIEYLGVLNDIPSGPKFVEILEKAKQPMLVATLLKSISRTCNSEQIHHSIEIMLSDGNDEALSSLYLWEILNLIGKEGNIEEISKILCLDINYNIYADDIIDMIINCSKRLSGLFTIETIRETTLKILNVKLLNSKTLLNIYHMLEVCKDKNIRLRVKKISLSDVWEEKKLKYALIALFKEERHGIIA